MSPKQLAFVREYLVDLNATQAAIRAGYSKKTARSVGAENLTKPDIKAAVAIEMDKRSARTGITADRVLKELASIGFADTTLAISIKRGSVKITDTEKLDDDTRRAISEIRQTTSTTGGSIGIKFHDKKGALELLGKHLGIFKDDADEKDAPSPIKVEISVTDGRKQA